MSRGMRSITGYIPSGSQTIRGGIERANELNLLFNRFDQRTPDTPLRPLVSPSLDPLQFAYQQTLGVEDAITFLLHRARAHLDRLGSTVRIMFMNFSSAFNTIRPALLGSKLTAMQVDPPLVSWITDYLTGRPQ